MTNDRVMGFISLIGVDAGVRRQRLVLSIAPTERFHLKMETESSLRNIVFKMNNVQNCDSYINLPVSQTYIKH
jgi:hypothetical protein